MTIYNVALADGTVGKVDDDTLDGQHPSFFIGDVVDIYLHDENGNFIEASGILVEILSEA